MKQSMTLKEVTARLEVIEKRNKKVEADKAWETSWTRRIGICIVTYITMVLALTMIKNDNPFVNAVIPTLGFFLSTLSLSVAKRYWITLRK